METLQHIISYEELKKYIDKPILLGYDSEKYMIFGWAIMLKAFEPSTKQFPYSAKLYGNRVVQLYNGNKFKPMLMYKHPLNRIIESSSQTFIRPLTTEEFKAYKKILVETTYKQTEILHNFEKPKITLNYFLNCSINIFPNDFDVLDYE